MLAACASSAVAQQGIDPKALAIIERTRTTRADYSMFAWNHVTPSGGEPREEWSAEFNKGHFHRVETPRDRLVADCAAGTGTGVEAGTDKVFSGSFIADAACGVQANSTIVSATYDGQTEGPFGPVDLITVSDPKNVRTYQVAANGAIVGATIRSRDGHLELEMITVALQHSAPEDIYSEKSLAESAVPEKYRKPPA